MKFIYALALVLFTQLGFSQQLPKELQGIDDEIIQLMEEYNTIGLSVAIVKDDKVLYAKGFGYRDFKQKLPVTEHTLFHIASMSKAFTGSLLGVLESNNRLSLKDKPEMYVPNFQFYNDKMNNLITIEDLLSHKSGIGTQGVSLELFPIENKLKTVQRLRYLKPEAEVKNSWEYSNMGYTLAGTIVEQITNKSWDANIQEKIFSPLKMNNSCTTLEDMKRSNNFSLGYGMYNGKSEKVPYQNYYAFGPAGSIKSSIKDLSNWMRIWLNKGVFNGNQIIPQEYIYKASRPQNVKYNEEYTQDSFLFSEGFGWRIRSWNGYYRLCHGGNTHGFSSVMELFPFEKIGIVVLCNQSNSTLPYIISDMISKKLFQLPSENEYPVLVSDIYKPGEDKSFNRAKMPTHSINDFLGTYYANGFGRIEIIKKEGKLRAVFPTYTFKLEHSNYNNFYLKGMKDFKESFNPEFTIKFVDNAKGKISMLKMYAQKEPIKFNKE
ncbi:serine hydrolase [Aquimarina sp. 2201CG14-23]|uniref:serine hydrolase n=1 Tax=Aquimarina mycalae TaxID=3040073 RepID=UPI00247820AB|nr:serine hydrolase [Aquimarina sp. 2201CG14-23]MDH7445957.1 serine hydrolase [Aquimarina sp. 2201CG14-23]